MYSYLASPYTHIDPRVKFVRYEKAERAMHQLLMEGRTVYSPIAMTHHAAVKYEMPKESSWWRKFNFAMLDSATDLIVLKMDFWEKSEGLADEIRYAKSNQKPVLYMKEGKDGWTFE